MAAAVLGLLVVFAIIGGLIGGATIFILRAVFSSQVDQAQHPVITWLSTALGLLVLLAVTVPAGWFLVRLHWRRWRLRLRGVTAAATVMRIRTDSRASADDTPVHRADVVVPAAGSVGPDSLAADGTWLTVQVPQGVVRGRVLRVRYDPADLTNAQMADPSVGNLLGTVVADLLLATLLIGIVVIVAGMAYLLTLI